MNEYYLDINTMNIHFKHLHTIIIKTTVGENNICAPKIRKLNTFPMLR